jgi:hypothetical protein
MDSIFHCSLTACYTVFKRFMIVIVHSVFALDRTLKCKLLYPLDIYSVTHVPVVSPITGINI